MDKKLEMHGSICDQLKYVYKSKNADYGDSFGKARKVIPNYTLGRLYDKFNRYMNLTIKGEENAQVDESIDDTLIDMANYAIMELTERRLEKDTRNLTINGYQNAALRTASGINSDGDDLILNGVMGLCGESGECTDMVKKYRFQGHELDTSHLAKELGDVAWYLAVTAHAIGYDLETILRMNVDKLRKRYPDGFEADRSIHRKDGDV